MKLLHRYVLKEISVFFTIALVAFTGVLLTLRMLRFATLIVDKGVEFSQVLNVFIAIVPTFLEVAIPLATLLGVMMAFARFSGDSEIIVLRASGVSIYRMIVPVLMFGLCASVMGLFVAQRLKPWGHAKLSSTLFEIARTRSTSGLEAGIFNKLGLLTLYAEEIGYRSGELAHVLIDDRRTKDQRKIIHAKSGAVLSDPEHQVLVLQLNDGSIHERVEGKYSLTDFNTNSLVLDPSELVESDDRKRGKVINELPLNELQERVHYYQHFLSTLSPNSQVSAESYPQPLPQGLVAESLSYDDLRKKLKRVEIEIGQRYSLPFAALALALLALPLGIQPARAQRTWGIGLSAVLGLLTFVFYYGLFSVGLVVAQNGSLPPTVALWAPNICVLAAALYLNYKTGSEQWQSIAHGIEKVILHHFPQLKASR